MPQNLVANGPDRPNTVWWTGAPTFPVTVYAGPRSCPTGYTCNSVQHRFTTHANPLSWNAWHCQGVVPAGFVFRYYVWAIDANGQRAPKVAVNVPCRSADSSSRRTGLRHPGDPGQPGAWFAFGALGA